MRACCAAGEAGQLASCPQAARSPTRPPSHHPPLPSAAPPQGLDYLFEHKLLLRDDVQSIATFLRTGAVQGGRKCSVPLDRKAVGDYVSLLGKTPDSVEYHARLLRAYVSGFAFGGQAFTASLRAYLAAFQLPGEAQPIARVMEAFSQRYAKDNPGKLPSPNPAKYSSADLTYILAFAAVMLTTDLYKPGNRSKMTREQFARNTQGATEQGAARPGAGSSSSSSSSAPAPPYFPPSLLDEVYADIARAPLAVASNPAFATFSSPTHQGWLLKRCTGPIPRWKRRLFLLTDGVLYYFSSEADVAAGRPRCILPLERTLLQLVGSLGLRIVPRPPQSRAAASAAAAAAATAIATAGTPDKHQSGVSRLLTPPPPLPHLRPVPSSELSGSGSAGEDAPHPAAVLKCAKRNADGSVKQARQNDFEMRASSAAEREVWVGAITEHMRARAAAGVGGGGSPTAAAAARSHGATEAAACRAAC